MANLILGSMILLAAALSSPPDVMLDLPTVPLFGLSENETDRDAVLLEVCDLPDKQLKLSEADLDGIVSRFNATVPVKIEHQDTVFDPLGSVQRIWRDGSRLLGRLSFAPVTADFLRGKGAVKLSCGLKRMSDDLRTVSLSEVSLVLKPRLQAACLLSEDDATELLRLRADNARILLASRKLEVDAQVVTLKLAGKIVPATEAAARVLLMASRGDVITLAEGGTLNTAEAFAVYLAAQPPLVTLGELKDLTALSVSSSADGNGATELTVDQREFLEKSLGVNADHTAQHMAGDKSKSPSAMMATPKAAPKPATGGMK